MKSLHDLPPFRDRWSYLYLEYGTLEQEKSGLVFSNRSSVTTLPVDQLSLIMLGPGTTTTHAAIKGLAENNCLLAWVAQEGTRLYAHSTGGTFSSRRLIRQAFLVSDPVRRLEVAARMFQKRFPGETLADKTLEQLRGMEGIRVRAVYARLAEQTGVEWSGRNYDQDNWFHANPVNRALSAAHACLYGVCHAALVSAGYSAALGFMHTGKMLSFVYDVADLYKTELTVPLAFRLAATEKDQLERKVRMACRDAFFQSGLMERILPDIAEVLGGGDDLAENAGELEGLAVSLADRTDSGGVCGPGEPEDPGRTVDQGVQEDQGEPETGGTCSPDVDGPD